MILLVVLVVSSRNLRTAVDPGSLRRSCSQSVSCTSSLRIWINGCWSVKFLRSNWLPFVVSGVQVGGSWISNLIHGIWNNLNCEIRDWSLNVAFGLPILGITGNEKLITTIIISPQRLSSVTVSLGVLFLIIIIVWRSRHLRSWWCITNVC